MNTELILNIICYAGTGFTLLSYCFRTLKLRIFLVCGNVVTVEPGIYVAGRYGCRIEDLVVIRENGIENLTKSSKALIEL